MLRRAAIALAALVALSGCGREAVSRAATGPRVVSLTPAVTALVVALGRGSTLAGVTSYCDAPGVPVVGDMRPDPERVVAQGPDLIVAARYAHNTGDLESLRARGLPVLSLELRTLDDLRAAIGTLGERLDARDRAAVLRGELDAALADARASAAARPGPALRVLLVYEVSGGHVYTTGGGDHVDELLRVAGGVNVAAGRPFTARLGLEEVIALAPDVLVHTAPTPQLPDDAAARAFWARLPDVPAVRAGRVHVWPDGSLAQPGPPLAGALRRLVALLDGRG